MPNTGLRIRVLGAEPFIYAPPTSRGRADERAFHLALDALNRAAADAVISGYRMNAVPADPVRCPDGFLDR